MEDFCRHPRSSLEIPVWHLLGVSENIIQPTVITDIQGHTMHHVADSRSCLLVATFAWQLQKSLAWACIWGQEASPAPWHLGGGSWWGMLHCSPPWVAPHSCPWRHYCFPQPLNKHRRIFIEKPNSHVRGIIDSDLFLLLFLPLSVSPYPFSL